MNLIHIAKLRLYGILDAYGKLKMGEEEKEEHHQLLQYNNQGDKFKD